MGIRREFRWWILTLAIIGVLLLISSLALDRPDVVWEAAELDTIEPHCPHCRVGVESYSTRCPSCREQYDWVVAPDDVSPYSPYSLSALEAEHVRARKEKLGRETVVRRVAGALGFSVEAAGLYVDHLARGRCGWCGGTGIDLTGDLQKEEPCAACFGRRQCVACDGDRRVRVGDPAAHADLAAYRAHVEDLESSRRYVPPERAREEMRKFAEAFLIRHHGSEEAQQISFWPDWGHRPLERRVVQACRERLDEVLNAMEAD